MSSASRCRPTRGCRRQARTAALKRQLTPLSPEDQAKVQQQFAQLTPKAIAVIRALARDGNIIQAIVVVREQIGLSLRDAKFLVENYPSENRSRDKSLVAEG